MIKGSLFHKCLSIVMVVALLAGLASPAAAAVSDSYGREGYSDYVALGDAATYGVGLDDDILNYSELVAEALGCADSLSAYADARYRIEEIRYLLDDDYEGDAYTGKLKIRDTIREEVQQQVAHAKYITINVGMNNFATYIVEQMMYYAENGGATKYSYSFDDFADENMVEAMENVKSIVMERLLAASPETGDKALELINFVTEVSVYAVLSYITSFNATVNSIYELNPDVDLYIVGLYNFCEDETLSLTVEGRTVEIPIGDVFGALMELANMYIQLFGDRVSKPYIYVDPGKPELLIDQMGNTNLSADERIPDGLMAELIELAGDAAIDGIVELFEEYGLNWTEEDAEEFLLDLVSYPTTAEREAFIESKLLDLAGEIAYDEFVKQLDDRLGKFGKAEDVVTEDELADLLERLGNADEADRYGIAYEFVKELIANDDLKRQAAAQFIYNKLQEQDELNSHVTEQNVEDLLLTLDNVDSTSFGTDEEYKAALKNKIDSWVSTYLLLPRLNEIYADFELDGYNSISEFFADVESKADPDAFIREVTLNAVVKEIEADSRYTQNAVIISALGLDIEIFFAKIDNALKANPELTAEEAIRAELGVFAVDTLVNVLTEGYTKYDEAANSAVKAYKQYLEIKSQISEKILTAYLDNYVNGDPELSGFADLQALCDEAALEIVDGYNEYEAKMDEAMDKADAYNGDLDNAYLTLMSVAEIDKISLNAIVNVGKNVYNGGNSYIESVVDDVLTNTLGEGEKTIAYLAVRYFLGNAMMIMPSAKGHQTIANNIIDAIENGEDVNSDFGYWGNKIIDGSIDLYRCAKAFIKSPDQASGQVGTLINPKYYVALGDNITSGTALAGDKNYVELLAEALAMEFDDIADIDQDVINNLAINGMRTEELYALVSNYAGDAYTDSRFSDIASLRDEYLAAIQDAELITIEVGINNLVTYPLTQTLLAYNDKDTHEMDWAQYFGESRADKLSKGKNAVMKLLLHVVDSVDNRVVKEATGKSAYDECRIALNTVSTAIESMAYGLLGYAVHLDASVEEIADMNEEATIVLVGFYNPLEDTTFIVDETVSHGSHSVDLSQYEVKVEYIGEFMLEIADRFLANYVGNTRGGENANDEGSRLLNVKINDAPLGIHNSGVSMDLADLNGQATITVKGHSVTFPVPEYFDELYHAGSNALHPSAEGHQYICDEILKVLDFEIHADVVPEDNWKYYGDEDPELTFVMDDKSSLYDELIVELTREAGEDVGFYDIYASLLQNTGYYEVDTETLVEGFEIIARPVTVLVVLEDGAIKTVSVTGGSIANRDAGADLVGLLGLTVNGNTVTANSKNYDVTVNVQNVEAPDYVCENTRTGVKYEIVHLAVLDAQPGDTIRMLKDSNESSKISEYHFAPDINLINGITLDLADYTLVVNSLFAAEGSCVIGNGPARDGTGGAKLIVPVDNLILNGSNGSINEVDKRGEGNLPVWDEANGYYRFANVRVMNFNTDHVLTATDTELRFEFDINATNYIRDNLIADNGVTDNQMSVEVYLEWYLKDEGVAHQTFVFDDELVANAAGNKDLVFILTNYKELGIELETLTIKGRIVSASGAIVEGMTFDVNGIVESDNNTNSGTTPDYTFTSVDGYVCENVNNGMKYRVVHDAVREAAYGDVIKMIADSDQTLLTDICPSAGMLNLFNGVRLNLDGHILKLDSLVVCEGSYVIGGTPDTSGNGGGKLIVPAENFVLKGSNASIDDQNKRGEANVPVWDVNHYRFANVRVSNTKADHVLTATDTELRFEFDINATNYIRDNLIADNGVTDNRMSVEVYLEWYLEDEGVAHQTFVFDDELVANAAGNKDLVFILTNYKELGIDLDTLSVTARISTDSGVVVDSITFIQN